jgi:esterase/lipase superfamily enzyme
VHVEDHGWWSPALGCDMPLRVYGHDGRPVVAFPPQDGRFWTFADFGMVEAAGGLIEAGRIRIVAVDSLDWETWSRWDAHPADRGLRYGAYQRYLSDELAPWIRERTGWSAAWTTGCSMGAYHAATTLFRRPDLFDGCVAISGLYRLRHFVGEYVDDAVYYNSPILFLPGLDDPATLDRLRSARIALVAGQGAWEEEVVDDTRAMAEIMATKGIPAIVDFWGHDVEHDWPWWRRMLPYELERLGA